MLEKPMATTVRKLANIMPANHSNGQSLAGSPILSGKLLLKARMKKPPCSKPIMI